MWDVAAAVKGSAAGAPRAPIRVLKGDKRGCSALALFRDGAAVLCGSARLTLLDATTGGRLGHSEKHAGSIGSVAGVPGTEHAVTACGDRFVSVWDAAGASAGALLGAAGSLVAPAAVKSLAASPVGPDGRYSVAAVLADGALCFWRCAAAAAVAAAAAAGARVAAPGAPVSCVHLLDAGAAAVVAIGADAAVRFERIAVTNASGALAPGALSARAGGGAGPAAASGLGGEGGEETVVDAAVPAQAR